MIDPQLRQILSQGYAKIGEISYTIALNLRKGKDKTPSQRKLYEQGIRMTMLLKILFRHVSFVSDTNNTPILWRITETQVNRYVRLLIEIGDLKNYPIVPTLFPDTRPVQLNAGPQGPQGDPGLNGSDADVVVELAPGESQISLAVSQVGTVKHYAISLNLYKAMAMIASIAGTKIFEIGTSNNVNLTLTITKGSKNILTITCNISAINSVLQPLINLATLNGVGQPNSIIVPLNGQTASTTYNFTISDGSTSVVANDSLVFTYPYFYGAADASAVNPYANLTKLVAPKGNRGVLLNGTDTKFSIGFPQSYGHVSKIRDGNGFDVTSSFTEVAVNVTSTGLTTDYVAIPYYFYISTVKTTIANQTYTIEH